MRIIPGPAVLLSLGLILGGCSRNSDAHDAAHKAGETAYKLTRGTKEAAKKAERELKDAGREAKAGWNDAKRKAESDGGK